MNIYCKIISWLIICHADISINNRIIFEHKMYNVSLYNEITLQYKLIKYCKINTMIWYFMDIINLDTILTWLLKTGFCNIHPNINPYYQCENVIRHISYYISSINCDVILPSLLPWFMTCGVCVGDHLGFCGVWYIVRRYIS